MLFDNWNETTSATQSLASNRRHSSVGGCLSRFSQDDDGRDDDDADIFTLERLHWEPNEDESGICSAVVANNTFLVLTKQRWLVRWDLLSDAKAITKVSSNDSDEVYRLFTDDSATHVLVTLASGQIIYFHPALKKPIQLCESGVIAESVAWIPSSKDRASCLIGSRAGEIYELDLFSKERNLQQRFSLPSGHRVCGIQLELLPVSSPAASSKWLVMIASPTRLFQLVGGPTMAKLFNMFSENEASFIELPSDLTYSELHFHRDSGRARTVSWLTGAGIYHGKLAFDRDREVNTVVEDYRLIPYPKQSELGYPVSMSITGFHFVFLYKRRVLAVNQKSLEIVFEAPLAFGQGDMMEMVMDPALSTMFIYSPASVCEIIVEREERHMWKLFLRDKQFAEALEFVTTDEEQAEVLNAQGDHLFEQGLYLPAAAIYSRSSRTFEEIALKFISNGAHAALIAYLRKRLDLSDERDSTQRTMMCTWLTELYMDSLGNLRDGVDTAAYEDMTAEFEHFLSQRRRELDRNTTFELLSSHGRVAELLQYAEMIGDREWVVNYNVQHGQYEAALEALVAPANDAALDHLYYQFAPVLLEHLPSKTVDALLRLRSLDSSRLLPALMRYEGSTASKEDGNVALRFLEEVIENRGCEDPALHNYMVSLLVKLGDSGERLLQFVDRHARNIRFDVKFALRLCHQEGLQRATVRLYVLMDLFTEAMETALKVDLALAKEVAQQLDEQHPDHKALWMKLAKHVMQSSSCSTQSAVQLLKECPCIRLDDLLPFFPDDVRIADFKQEIVDALDSYNERIEALKTEMEEYRRGAEQLRDEALALRYRSAVLSWGQTCRLCNRVLMDQPFYLFPCEHAVHIRCAIAEVRKLRRVTQNDPHSFFDSDDDDGDHVDEALAETVQKRSDRSDADVALTSCVLCSDLMIDSVDKPFSGQGDDRSWDI